MSFGALRGVGAAVGRSRSRVRPLGPFSAGGTGSGTGSNESTPGGATNQSEFDAAQTFFLGLAGTPGSTFSQDTLKGFQSQLNAQGIELLVSGSGITQKIRLPSGRVVDVIGGSEAGGGTGTLQFDDTGVDVDSPSGGSFSAGSIFGGGAKGAASTLGSSGGATPRPGGSARPRQSALGSTPRRQRSPLAGRARSR